MLVIVRHTNTPEVAGFGTAVFFFAATGLGQFLAAVVMPASVAPVGPLRHRQRRRWRSPRSSSCAASGLQLPMMVACGFLLGVAGQVVKLCADTAMQIDVDDALRGHVFTVQDALFWIAFIVAMTLAATVIPADGHEPALVLAGVAVYIAGLAVHATIGERASTPG